MFSTRGRGSTHAHHPFGLYPQYQALLRSPLTGVVFPLADHPRRRKPVTKSAGSGRDRGAPVVCQAVGARLIIWVGSDPPRASLRCLASM
jgi:hypothetical protein